MMNSNRMTPSRPISRRELNAIAAEMEREGRPVPHLTPGLAGGDGLGGRRVLTRWPWFNGRSRANCARSGPPRGWIPTTCA